MRCARSQSRRSSLYSKRNTSNVFILQPFGESEEWSEGSEGWDAENTNKAQGKLVNNLREFCDGLEEEEGFRIRVRKLVLRALSLPWPAFLSLSSPTSLINVHRL